eukprot:g38519.t1
MQSDGHQQKGKSHSTTGKKDRSILCPGNTGYCKGPGEAQLSAVRHQGIPTTPRLWATGSSDALNQEQNMTVCLSDSELDLPGFVLAPDQGMHPPPPPP